MFQQTLTTSSTVSTLGGTQLNNGNISQLTQMNEDIERLKRELLEQQSSSTQSQEELTRLQRRYVYAEHCLAESQTALAAAARSFQEESAHQSLLVQQLQAQIEDLTSQASPSQAHAQTMLQLEKLIPSLLIEVMFYMSQRSEGAVTIGSTTIEAVKALSPVGALMQLRMWVRKLMEQDFESNGSAAHRKNRSFLMGDDPAARLIRAVNAVRSQVRTGGSVTVETAAMSPTPSSTAPSTAPASPPRRASVADSSLMTTSDPSHSHAPLGAYELRKRNLELEREVESMQNFVREAETEIGRIRQASQVAVYAARKDLGNLKMELRAKSREVETLRNRTFLVDRSELVAVTDELNELRKKLGDSQQHAAAAMQAKAAEYSQMERQQREEMRDIQRKLTQLEKSKSQERKLEIALRTAQGESQQAKQMLARANVKALLEDSQAQAMKLKQQEEEMASLKRELSATQTALKGLKATNEKMISQYNEIFEARMQEQYERSKRLQQRHLNQAAHSIVGPNSDLNAQYYRTRYQEALQELKKAHKKLKHLIFLSHHDHLSFGLQREDLAGQLRNTKKLLFHSSAAENDDYDDDDAAIMEAVEKDHRVHSGANTDNAEAEGDDPTGESMIERDDDPLVRQVMQGDDEFSFSAFQKKSLRSKSPPSSKHHGPKQAGYDIISTSMSMHEYQIPVVGVTEDTIDSSAGVYSNPLEQSVTAKVKSTLSPPVGKELEPSKRSSMGHAQASLERIVETKPDGSVIEAESAIRSTPGASGRRYNTKADHPVAYLRKSRLANGVGTLSRAMTPVGRPSSALL